AIAGEANDVADLSYGAAAAAYVVAPGGFATLEGFACRYSSYANVWRGVGERVVRRYDDERFDRHAGYSAQMAEALAAFRGDLSRDPDWYALQLSGGADAARVASTVPPERLLG